MDLPKSASRASYGLLVLLLAACEHSPAGGHEARKQAETTFAGVCARCHGADGKGGVAAGTANAPRNFNDAEFQKSRTDQQLKDVIVHGKGGMPGFGKLFPDPDLDALVAKIRSFDPAKKP